ncbi:UNVERIFIED_CONTAM: hypothetical protein Sindi_0848800 [Sesamum indicum]
MSNTKKSIDEAELIRMQISENTGASLVSSVLNGKNCLSWSKAMRIALGAKMKVEYIDGESEKPQKNSNNYKQWLRNDCLVTSWILNSVSKDIAENFIFTNSARELWVELEKHLGEKHFSGV